MDYKKAWEELRELSLEREKAYKVYNREDKLEELTNIIRQMRNIEDSYNKYDKYKKIFVEFNRFTKENLIFNDNDGEVIKSTWDEIVNRNS